MNKRRFAAAALSASMLLAVMAGCSQQSKGSDTTKSSPSAPSSAPSAASDTSSTPSNSATPGSDNAQTSGSAPGTPSKEWSGETTNLTWFTVGGGLGDNYDAWKQHADEYLSKYYGVTIDYNIVPWADWDQRRTTMITSNEPFDILFTNISSYASDVRLNAFADITDELGKAAPDLKAYIPEMYWKGVSINDRIYGIPTYKDSSLSNYFIYDNALMEKYKLDYKDIHTMADLEPVLKAIKEGENEVPFPQASGGNYAIMDFYDGLGLGLRILGVDYKDKEAKVQNLLQNENVVNDLKLMHKWMKAGYINEDAATLKEGPSYRPVSIAQGWPLAAKTAWGPGMGIDAVVSQYGETILTNGTIQGSMNSISSSSKNVEAALRFLQAVNLDRRVRDMFYFGLEGKNFEYQGDRVKKLDEGWKAAGYTQATFFNVSLQGDDKFDQWAEVKSLNEAAHPSVLLGFTANPESFVNDLANVTATWKKYESEILTGTRDPEEAIPGIIEELNAAGLQKIIDECQKQVNEFLAAKK